MKFFNFPVVFSKVSSLNFTSNIKEFGLNNYFLLKLTSVPPPIISGGIEIILVKSASYSLFVNQFLDTILKVLAQHRRNTRTRRSDVYVF